MSKNSWAHNVLACVGIVFLILGIAAPISIKASPDLRPLNTPNLAVPIPNLTFTPLLEKDGKLTVSWLGDYISGLYTYMLGFSVTLAIVMMMMGGLQYVLSAGGAHAKAAKERIKNAAIGLVLLFAVYLLLFIVNPNLTVLKALTFKKIKPVFISTENTANDVTSLHLPVPTGTGTNSVPYFSQRNYDNTYGACGTIRTSGCGPTSAAMVLNFYHASVDPPTVARAFADAGYRACPRGSNPDCSKCAGTAYAAFSESDIINQNGRLTSTVLNQGDRDGILKLLADGKPILISIGPSRFTSGGHFMVLTGYKNGKIQLNDPNSALNDATPDEIFAAIKFAVLIQPKTP